MEQLTPVDPHTIEADCLVLFLCSDFYPLLDCLGLYFRFVMITATFSVLRQAAAKKEKLIKSP